MVGWVIDVLVGWLVGSIVFGLLFDVIAAVIGVDPAPMSSAGVVVGTVVGIWFMRRRRAKT